MPFTPYLNVTEIESSLASAVALYPAWCQLITLPNPTFEGRISHAILLRAGSLANRKGILMLGGTHAREWGSSDILVAFLENLLAAYSVNTGLTFQGKTYAAADVRRVLETLDLFLFPDVNPDGKAYSQSGHDWRKNRRPVAGAVGIDVNRNYDFVWDTNIYFNPAIDFSYLWTPSSGNYHGASPFSEAESQNIRWLLDTYPQITYFVDLHCYGQKIMCVWGDDENQSTEAEKRFDSPAYHGQRGFSGDAYGEFIFADDHQKQLYIAGRMRDAVFAVRGRSYTVGQIFNQVGVSAGDSAPYVFSRYLSDFTRRKIFSYGIEWGTSFQPLPAEMTQIIDDIGAGLMEMSVCSTIPDLYIRDSMADTGMEPSSSYLSMSPDIIVRKDALSDPQTALGDPAVDPGSDKVEIGNDNYVYVRVHNLGGQSAEAAVRVYYAPLTTTCAPSLWTLIDEISGIIVPAGGMAVAGPATWPHVPDPGTAGHFCLIALCGNTLDPFPDASMVDSAQDFIRWMRNGNNQAYRNITFENVRPDGWAAIPFLVPGFKQRNEPFNLEFDLRSLPLESRVEIQLIAPMLKNEKRMAKREIIRIEQNQRETHFAVQPGKISAFMNVRCGKSALEPLRLWIHLPPTVRKGTYFPVTVKQVWKQQEMGRFQVNIRRA
ncbi:MAG: hypothetical protein E4H23_01480 [Chrysiogenales bacterium]|nr:MAG: hypothetical protein E4H23_01480 [Chrysiogenales bacterium]